MISKNSRYKNVEMTEFDARGKKIRVFKLRSTPIIPESNKKQIRIKYHDRLDITSNEIYQEDSLYWKIMDVNRELNNWRLRQYIQENNIVEVEDS